MSLDIRKILVSSAKILVLPEGQQFGKSLMKIKNSSGPRTDPCALQVQITTLGEGLMDPGLLIHWVPGGGSQDPTLYKGL